jgi:alcohol dehydrogenase class IV
VSGDFVWRDAGRTVVFAAGGLDRAVEILAEHGVERFELLSTPRALADAPDLAAAAAAVHHVAPGPVPASAAALCDAIRPKTQPHLVALGGGRVIDTAKALAAVSGSAVAAIPTTMSGAEMTAIHKLPAGMEAEAGERVRPRLVLADPELMTSAPEPALRASSMNALAHGVDSVATPLSNPVAETTALRGAELIATAFGPGPEPRDRAGLALGSLLCGYAIDSAGFGLHHVVCQTLVRVCGTPHAETNAVVLPGAAAFVAGREPAPFTRLAAALGVDPPELRQRLFELAGSPPGLAALGADAGCRGEAVAAMLERSELGNVPGPPLSAAELESVLDSAWG